jgi:hypothetical protein
MNFSIDQKGHDDKALPDAERPLSFSSHGYAIRTIKKTGSDRFPGNCPQRTRVIH